MTRDQKISRFTQTPLQEVLDAEVEFISDLGGLTATFDNVLSQPGNYVLLDKETINRTSFSVIAKRKGFKVATVSHPKWNAVYVFRVL